MIICGNFGVACNLLRTKNENLGMNFLFGRCRLFFFCQIPNWFFYFCGWLIIYLFISCNFVIEMQYAL